VDNMDGTVNESEFGKLVLHSIPTKETQEMVVSYLSRIIKNVPAEKLAQRIKITPFVLSKNIAVKKGERIAQNLRDLGAKAEFVPHDPGARGLEPLSEEMASAPELESIQLMSEQNKPQQLASPESSRFGKHLITAVVVFMLIAVFSLLTWQLYHLLAEKFFN
jgi:hypothetical protein